MPSSMQGKPLDMDTINAIVARNKAASDRTAPKVTPFLSNDELIELQNVVSSGKLARGITLKGGRKYLIVRRVVLNEPGIYIRPADHNQGFCPCGEFRLSKLALLVKGILDARNS